MSFPALRLQALPRTRRIGRSFLAPLRQPPLPMHRRCQCHHPHGLAQALAVVQEGRPGMRRGGPLQPVGGAVVAVVAAAWWQRQEEALLRVILRLATWGALSPHW